MTVIENNDFTIIEDDETKKMIDIFDSKKEDTDITGHLLSDASINNKHLDLTSFTINELFKKFIKTDVITFPKVWLEYNNEIIKRLEATRKNNPTRIMAGENFVIHKRDDKMVKSKTDSKKTAKSTKSTKTKKSETKNSDNKKDSFGDALNDIVKNYVNPEDESTYLDEKSNYWKSGNYGSYVNKYDYTYSPREERLIFW